MSLAKLFGSTLVFAAIAPLSAQVNMTFSADRDATLYEDATGMTANGGGTAMFVGMTGQPMARRGLVHFDLSAIPPGSHILSATVIVRSTQSSSASAMAMTGHRLLQSWSEGATVAPGGQGSGGPAQAGDATWLHRNFATQLWTNAGGDFVAAPTFTMPVFAVGASGSGMQLGIVADVQSWVDSPASNHGWLLMGDETLAATASKLITREAGGGVELGVSFLLPGQVGRWGVGCTGGQPMTLWPAGPAIGGASVGLQYIQAPTSSIGASFFALALEYGPAGLGMPILPNCSSYLPPNGIVLGSLWLTNMYGQASDTLAIPNNAAGFLIVCQAAALDGSTLGFTLSNAAVMLTL